MTSRLKTDKVSSVLHKGVSLMTCIVAITDGENMVIGGDSAGVAGLRLTVRKDPKVFIREDRSGTEWLFGFTSSFKMGELIQYELALPEIKKSNTEDLYGFMVKEFIPAVRKCFKDGGYARKKDDEESAGTFLVCLLGRIFEIEGDYQVGEPMDNFAAVGCAEDVAKGSLYTTEGRVKSSLKRAQMALEAAERFSGGVRAPFVILESKPS